jgi:hypothetical protein
MNYFSYLFVYFSILSIHAIVVGIYYGVFDDVLYVFGILGMFAHPLTQIPELTTAKSLKTTF